MTGRRLVSVVLISVLAAVTAAAYWPAPRVDVQPAFERPAANPTETAVPLERPARPPHPRSIYTPGSHR